MDMNAPNQAFSNVDNAQSPTDVTQGETEAVDTSNGAEDQSTEAKSQAPVQSKGFNDEQRTIINEFIKTWDIPKGVDPVFGKDGKLNFLVKMNGEKYIVSPGQLIQGFGLNQAGYSKLEEAKKMRKEQEDKYAHIVNRYQKDKDVNALFDEIKKMGIDPEDAATRYLEDRVKYATMTQEQREAHEQQLRLKAERDEVERVRQENMKFKYDMELNKARQSYETELMDALKHHELDKMLNVTQGEKAEIMLKAIEIKQAHKGGGHDINFKDAIAIAKQTFQRSFNRMLEQYDNDHIVKMLPERVIEHIRKQSVKNLHDQPIGASADIGRKVEVPKYPSSKTQQKKTNLSDWMRRG